MILIDGSQGEGGGQIVRTALALSALTGQSFKVTGIRANRPTPGLKAQHLHGVKAAMKLCDGNVEGDVIGSQELTFHPEKLAGRRFEVDIGTAGSITLLLQSVLLPAMFAGKSSTITLIGGTNVAWSMPIEYLQEVLVPQLRRYVDKLDVTLVKRGYYPAGGGKVEVRVKPKWSVSDAKSFDAFLMRLRAEAPHLQLTAQHHLVMVKGISHASVDLQDARVAERQAQSARHVLRELKCPIDIRHEYADTASTGSGLTLWAIFSKDEEDIDPSDPVRLGADALGEKGKRAEQVGEEAAKRLLEEIKSGAAVDRHLADNLIPLMGLVCPSEIKTSTITEHSRTNALVVERFLKTKFQLEASAIRSVC